MPKEIRALPADPELPLGELLTDSDRLALSREILRILDEFDRLELELKEARDATKEARKALIWELFGIRATLRRGRKLA